MLEVCFNTHSKRKEYWYVNKIFLVVQKQKYLVNINVDCHLFKITQILKIKNINRVFKQITHWKTKLNGKNNVIAN